MTALTVTEERVGEIPVVLPTGRLDTITSPQFEQTLMGRLQGERPRLVIDLAGLDYLSSAGLRVLLIAAKRVKAANGRLALCSLQEQIREVFEISGFLSILNVTATREEAIAALGDE